MESHEVAYIQKKLPQLVEATVCNEALVAKLVGYGVLRFPDIGYLTSIQPPIAQVKQLYNIAQTRSGSYKALQKAFKETKQLKACKILSDIQKPREGKSLRENVKYKCAPGAVSAFLEDKTKALAITCKDLNVTLEKIVDTSILPVNVFQDTSIKIQGSPTKRHELNVAVSSSFDLTGILRKVDVIKEKLIILTQQPSQSILDTAGKIGIQNLLQVSKDSVRWSDLGENFQKEIVQTRRIFIQLKEFPLKDILHQLEINESDETQLDKLLDENSVLDLINEKTFPLLKSNLPPRLEYYISRKLASRSCLDTGTIFKPGFSRDVFAFIGINKEKLSEYICRFKALSNFPSSTARFILINKLEDFDDICSTTRVPVHLLRYDLGQFVWIKSKGNLTSIQNAVSTIQEEFDEEELIRQIPNIPIVIITGSPGMGKASLLCKMGKILQKKNPDEIIVFINVAEFIGNLEKGNTSLAEIVQVVASHGARNHLGRKWLTRGLFSGKIKLHLMLDSYDDLEPKQLEITNKCLVRLSLELKCVQVYVTTRNHFLNGLENPLQILGFSLQPLSESDQNLFLTSSWTGIGEDASRISTFSQECLNFLKGHLCRNRGSESFAAVPLHCLSISEVFVKNCAQFSQMDTILTSDCSPEFSIKLIPKLFENLILKKIQATFADFTEKDILYSHVPQAVSLLFPEWYSKLKIPPGNPKIYQNIIFKAGLMERKTSGQATFLHPTFAYYVVAWFIVEVFGEPNCSKEMNEFIFKTVLELLPTKINVPGHLSGKLKNLTSYTFKHRIILHFLNHLTQSDLCRPKETQHSKPYQISPIHLKNFTIACVNDDLESTFEFFFKFYNKMLPPELLFDKSLLQVAVSCANSKLLNSFLHKYPTLTGGYPIQEVQLEYGNGATKKTCSFLHLAVCRGNVKIVTDLLEKHKFRKLFSHPRDFPRHLLHFCVQNSSTHPPNLIQEKIKILRLLLSEHGSFLEERNEKGLTPLLAPYVHLQLLLEFIFLGADVLVETSEGETVLHLASKYLTPSEFHALVSTIPREALPALLKKREQSTSRTVLHRAVMRFDPLPDTLELFAQYGAGFNSRENHGNTVLLLAVANSRGVDCLQGLITHGADWNCVNNKLRTAIHSAAYRGCFEAVNFFSAFSMDVNVKDFDGNAPLHMALIGSQDDEERMKVIKYLIDRNADVNIKNGEDFTPLWHAFKVKPFMLDVRTIELLLSAGAVCTSEIATLAVKLLLLDGSRLSSDTKEEKMKFVQVCLDLGAVLSPTDERGRTLLHAAVQNGWLDIVNLLVSKGMDVNVMDNEKNTPLHVAFFQKDHLQVIQYLVEHGAEIGSRNSKNQTPLEFAIAEGLEVYPEARKLLAIESSLETPTSVEERPPEDNSLRTSFTLEVKQERNNNSPPRIDFNVRRENGGVKDITKFRNQRNGKGDHWRRNNGGYRGRATVEVEGRKGQKLDT